MNWGEAFEVVVLVLFVAGIVWGNYIDRNTTKGSFWPRDTDA